MSSSNQNPPLKRKDKVEGSMRLKSGADAKPKPQPKKPSEQKGGPKEHPIFGRTSLREASSRGE
jgi:hypothetical protein